MINNRLWIILIHTTSLITTAVPQFDFGQQIQQYFQIPQMPGIAGMSGMPGLPSMSGIPGMPSMSGMPGVPSLSGMLQMPSMSQMQQMSVLPSQSFYSSSSFGSNPSVVYETSGRRSSHHKHKKAKTESTEREDDESSDVSGECRCSCNKCDKPKHCCIPVCEQCNMIGANPGSVMLVPYAYPVFLTHPDREETTPLPTTTEIQLPATTDSEKKHENPSIRTIKRKLDHENTHDPVNNELDDVDMRLLKIIRMVQSEAQETNTMMSALEIASTRILKTTPTTTTTAPAKTTYTPETTTNTPATTTTQKTTKKKRPTATTTIASTTTASEEIIVTTTDTLMTLVSKVKTTYPNSPDDILNQARHQDNKHSKYILTSMRRMKENFLPKYGVVPIPDDVAEKLLKKIRSIKSGSVNTLMASRISHRHHHLPLNTRLGRYQDEPGIETL